MKYGWCALVFLLVAGRAAAQEPEITPATAVDSATLEKWLHGDDPRLIAWAADFVRRNPDPKILAEMPELLEHSSTPLDYGYRYPETLPPQVRADFAILDTLIQANASVPVHSIETIAPAFPAQAAILIGRHPLFESRATLGDWTLGTTGVFGNQLARIASMMLAKDPKASRGFRGRDLIGFVASVVAASETEIDVVVKTADSSEGGGGSVICGDFLGRKSPPGWPQVYGYDLAENYSDPNALVIVELDGDRIVSQRGPIDSARGSCDGGVEDLDSTTRHRLVAYWLGVPNKRMVWQPVLGVTIVWAGKADYEQRLGQIIESQREKLRATVAELQQRGFLTESEAASVTPRLSVVVKCDIQPCPLNLP